MSDMEAYPDWPGQGPRAGWYPLDGHLCFWDGHRWTGHRHVMPHQQAVPRQGHPYPGYAGVITDARTNPIELALAWILTLFTLGYLLPWAIAATRGKSNSWAVGLLSFLLGWTFVGWVVALVMACSPHQVAGIRA